MSSLFVALLELVFLTHMQHHLVRMPRRHPSVAFRPVIRYGVGEDVPVVIEAASSDRGWCGVKRYIGRFQ